MTISGLASSMKVDILFNKEGVTCIFHSEPLPEILKWVEYDADLETVSLVLESGTVLDLGLKISADQGVHMKSAKEVTVILVQNDEVADMGIVPVVIRSTQD